MEHSCTDCRYITDIHFQEHTTHIWSKDLTGNTFHHRLHFHPKIYVIPSKKQSLMEIKTNLQQAKDIISVTQKWVYPSSAENCTKEALELELYSFRIMKTVVKKLKSLHYDLYNIDLNPRQQFFLDYNASPLTKSHLNFRDPTSKSRSTGKHGSRKLNEYQQIKGTVELAEIVSMEDVSVVDYFVPPMLVMSLQLHISHVGAFPTNNDPLTAITIKLKEKSSHKIDQWHLEGGERKILEQLSETIQKHDPDFLMLEQGDKFSVNYLAHRAARHQLTDSFRLGRLHVPMYPKGKQAGQTYMTYGVILHKDAVSYIPGRIHLDYDNSFMLHESGIDGLIDISRLSATAPERASRASIGTVLTGVEFVINQQTYPKTLVPARKTKGEFFKTGESLLIGDNGGLTYPAIPGVYDRVWALDFTSLYPFIMLIHNIGGDTMMCEHQSCQRNKVPELGYHICSKRLGVVARTMGLMLDRRLSLKLMRKQSLDADALLRYKEIDSALKWLLVCCFGYLGFKNSRWGSIEGHQSVTAYGRRYLLQASKIAFEEGFEIIAGIVDSLFVRAIDPKDDSKERVSHLVHRISRETKIPLDVEGRFNWVVFGKVRDFNVMALNRYYGYFDHGEFKLRGIRLRQRRLTELERKFQEEILDLLKTATSTEKFMELLPSCYNILRKWKARLFKHNINTRDLIIKLKSHVGTGNYKSRTQQALVTQRYQELGREIQAGQNMMYVVRDDRARDTSRILINEEVDHDAPYDVNWYAELLDKALLELVESPQFQHFDEVIYSDQPQDRNLEGYFNDEKSTSKSLPKKQMPRGKNPRKKKRLMSLEGYFSN